MLFISLPFKGLPHAMGPVLTTYKQSKGLRVPEYVVCVPNTRDNKHFEDHACVWYTHCTVCAGVLQCVFLYCTIIQYVVCGRAYSTETTEGHTCADIAPYPYVRKSVSSYQ